MSDIGIKIPFWMAIIFIGFEAWPVVLAAAILSGAGAFLARGIVRGVLIALTVLLVAECLVAAWFWRDRATQDAAADAYYEATRSTLDAPQTVDGLALPAGTAVIWTDATRTHLWQIDLPEPTPLLGTVLDGHLEDNREGGWAAQLPSPTTIDGWPCSVGQVELSRSGRLIQCTTSADHIWQGRLVPAGTLLGYGRHDDTLPLLLPADRSMTFPDIPTALPGGSSLSLNPDGSLDSAYFKDTAPLVVKGIALSNSVQWGYAVKPSDAPVTTPRWPAATRVNGWHADDVTRDGQLYPGGADITISLPDGAVTTQ